MSRALKPEDTLELSKLYESEFNNPEIHDRVLIFDVVASWPRRPENEEIRNEAGSKNEDVSDGETITMENVQGISVNTSNENETGIHDGDSQNLNVKEPARKLMKLSNEREDNHMETATDGNNATPEILNENNEAMIYSTNEEETIRQHKLYIHSTWLAVQSSYFRSLFFGGMKETNSTEVHIKIPESEEKAHLMLLKAMYKIDALDNASVDKLLEVLKLAHKYDVKFVFKKAKYCLQATAVSFDICEKIMCFIKVDNTITDVDDLASTLQSFLAKEFSPLDETWKIKNFGKLSEPSLRCLLSSNELVAASENTIFHALMYWIKQHGIENVLESKEMPSLLSTVRFELISFDYLYNIVQHDAVAKKFPDFQNHYLRGISYHAMSDEVRETLRNQPVKRKEFPDTAFIPYTWVIPKNKLDALDGKFIRFQSDTFWYCGYRVVLTISHVEKDDSYNQRERFNAKLSLKITNLKQHSAVKISWSLGSSHNIIRKTFKDSEHKSMVNITIEVQKEKSTIAKTSLSSDTLVVVSYTPTYSDLIIDPPELRSPPIGFFFGSSMPATPESAPTKFSFATSPTFSGSPRMEASKPGFNFCTPFPTKTTVTSKPGFNFSFANQKSPNAPCLSIDVMMNLV